MEQQGKARRLGLATQKDIWLVALCVLLAGAVFLAGRGTAAESAVRIPPPAADASASSAAQETAVFAGGCFWACRRCSSTLPA